MKTLIAFATRWGPHFGGINSFNKDLLEAFAAAFSQHIRTVCIVLFANSDEIQDAKNSQVTLLSLDFDSHKEFSASFAVNAWAALQAQEMEFSPDHTVWLGHDRITGDIAVTAANTCGGRSAVIHHMSYDHYESFSEKSTLADNKCKAQKRLFEQASIVMAVGPLLRDALAEMLDHPDIPMLVPGLPDIKVKLVIKSFRGFISGRLSDDAKKIKQGHLGVAAFASAIQKADSDSGLPDALRGANEPELTLRGVEFEQHATAQLTDAEIDLKLFAEEHAGRAIRMHALPFTADRKELFDDLRSSSVAMMPSWHEGFGLVGWEAIAAGVPLIVSEKSGLYRLLLELEIGIFANLVFPIDVAGSNVAPFFQTKDREVLAQRIIEIAKSPELQRKKAVQLREALLQRFRWANCAHSLAQILGWTPHVTDASSSVESKPALPKKDATAEQFASNVLEMPCPTWRANAGLSDSWLLRAEEAVIPFDPDREAFLEEQLDWAHSEGYPITIRLLTGVGGTGKTRLALELCKRLQSAGWQTGFLPNDSSLDKVALSLAKSAQPVCLVIDYAETRQSQLLQLIKVLGTHFTYQVRILLLARDGGEWWKLLPAKDSACEALLDGLATTGPYQLPQLYDSLESRQVAFKRAMAAFAEKLSLPEQASMPKLDDDHFGHPLYVQMAALLSLHGEQPGSAESVARSLIGHERRYWAKAMTVIPDMTTQQDECAGIFMALATLANGLPTVRESESLWAAVGGSKLVLKLLFNMLAQLYPSRQGVQALRPDLLGEALVAQCLLGANGTGLLNAVLGNRNSALRRSSLTVLARLIRNREELSLIIEPVLTEHFLTCADDLVAVIVETPSPLARIAEKSFATLPTPRKNQACGILDKYSENEIIPLVDLIVLVKRAILAKLESKTGRVTDDDQARKASALNNLSVGLVWQGHVEEAKDLGRQALVIFEALARNKPNSFEPDWALSLNNYANRLGDLGRYDEAESCSRQAVEIYAKLARTNPERFESVWATSLDNYANHLRDLGLSDRAETYARQALDIRAKLARAKPERFEPEWATSLGNYANHLCELGLSNRAETYAKQALEIRSRLARAMPARFEPNMAISLYNYACHLCDQGHYDEAEIYARQSLELYEKLAHTLPAHYEYDFIWSSMFTKQCGWLAGKQPLATEHPLACYSTSRQQKTLDYYRGFCMAFASNEPSKICQGISKAEASWVIMDATQRRFVEKYRFLLAGLAESLQIVSTLTDNWREDLARFSSQRNGQLPIWMQEVARRTGITL
ncbi:MAG TPA: tetratricopeptide repeat protein [Fluviicoccus sp.]|nr:tetratricopeptide repeat protein [Fluviicoccus sp.]